MKTKNNFLLKLLSVFLSIVIVIGVMPITALANNSPLIQSKYNGKIVDTPTVNSWKNVFPTDTSANAGGVWADKSVFVDVDSYKNATDENDTTLPIEMQNEANNFLVSLSAMSSTKSITGYSTIPTDTVLVLDMSSSMRNNGNYIDDLAIAANSAIKRLIGLNYNNRVGVVLYSGAGKTNIFMPLDRYTAGNGGNFVEYRRVNNREGIATVSGVEKNGVAFSKQDSYNSGTFTQDGIYQGMKQLLNSDTIVTEGIQAGVSRMPIMVLMTDGEPSHSDSEFSGNHGTDASLTKNNGTSGGGYDGCDFVEFLNQLNAAYAKLRVEEKYKENDMLFYTVGFRLSALDTVPVLDPSNKTYTDTDKYWENFLKGNTVEENTKCLSNDRSVNPNNYPDFVNALNGTDGDHYRYYSNRYLAPADGDELTTAFDAIVDEIILQSKYYPTHVESGTSVNYGGYLSITDTLGEYMEVKDIKGIQLGNHLFTGAHFVSKLNSTVMGSPEVPTGEGDELIRAIRERLGIEKLPAQELVDKAYNAGQLSYTNDEIFSNWVGWYGNYVEGENRWQYKGFWDGIEGSETTTPRPSDATYQIKSYLFYGEATEGTKESDMLYAACHIQKNLDTGVVKVYCRAPASLIPMREYNVTLEAEDLTKPSNLTVSGSNYPIRLLYEVGLKDGINSLNVKTEAPNARNTATGEYEFYSNAWPDGTAASSMPDADTSHVLFYASKENERYYFHNDSLIYSDTYGTLYTGAKPTATNGTYYTLKNVYSGSGTNVTYTPVYERIIDGALADANVALNSDGYWYVKKGTPRLDTARTSVDKETNITGTYEMVERPEVYNGIEYRLQSMLGNNGKLTVVPAQGIKLRKYVATGDAVATADNTYKFTIKAYGSTDALSGDYTYFLADGIDDSTPTGAAQTVTADSNGVITVNMKKNQTIYIVGLKKGTYLVNEDFADKDYMVSSFRIDGAEQPIGTPVTVYENTLTAAAFLNSDRIYGEFRLSKFVESTYAPHKTDEFDFTFDITVELAEGTNPNYYVDGYTSALINNSDTAPVIDLSDDGKDSFTITLSDNDAFSIPQLPDGAKVIVTETHINRHVSGSPVDSKAFSNTDDYGFTTTVHTAPNVSSETRNGVSEIVGGEQVGLRFYNTYASEFEGDANITVNAHKTLEGRDWDTDDSFEFNLTRSGVTTPVSGGTIDDEDSDKAITLSMSGQTYTAVGTFPYYVSEVIGTIPGMKYDDVPKNFGVEIADDGFGNLYIANIHKHQANSLITIDNSTGDWVIDAYFTNSFTSQGAVSIDLGVKKAVETQSNAIVSKGGYNFNLYKVDNFTNISLTGLTPIEIVTTSGDGLADFADLTFTDSDRGNTYYYVIVEEKGNKVGIAYSNAAYGYKVEVDESSGATSVTVTQYKGEINRNTNTVTLPTADAPISNAYTGIIPIIVFDTEFTNTYTPSPVPVSLSATKTLTGRSIKADDRFVIELYKVDSATDTNTKPENLIDSHTVAIGENGVKFNFNLPSFEKIGTYYYVIKEKIPVTPVERVQYDTGIYQVTVVVTNNEAEGKLAANYSVTFGGQVKDAEFNNIYTPNPVSLSIPVNKTLYYTNSNNLISFSKATFKVGLYEVTPTGNILKAEADFGAANADNGYIGTAIFNLTYDRSDVRTSPHEYIIKEIIPTEATQQPDGSWVWNGCKYDTTETNITVNVYYDEVEGILSTTLNNAAGPITTGAAAKIENTYTSTDTYIDFSGTKYLTDTKFSSKQKFYFELYKTGSDFATANVTPESPLLEVEVEKNGSVISDGFAFQEKFTQPGAYHYVLKEQIPQNAEVLMNYDPNTYQITVLVTDNGKGKLTAVPTVFNTSLQRAVAVNRLDFYNTRLRPDDFVVELGISKKVEGITHSAEGFKFAIRDYDSTSYNNIVGETLLVSDADGKASISIPFTESDIGKTYYYEAVEMAGTEKYMSYDKTVYRYSITISLNSEKELVAEVKNISEKESVVTKSTDTAPQIVTSLFLNKFTPDDNVLINIEKTIKNLGKESITPDNFQFVITETDKDYKPLDAAFTQKVISSAKGYATFDEIIMAYDSVRYFTVAEVNDNKDYVTYDNTVYKLCIERKDGVISIASNPNGKLAANAVSLSFENLYDYTIPTPEPKPEAPKSPKTGDASNLYLWLALLFVSGSGIIGTAVYGKKKTEETE